MYSRNYFKKNECLPNIKNYNSATKNRSVYNRASEGVCILVHIHGRKLQLPHF